METSLEGKKQLILDALKELEMRFQSLEQTRGQILGDTVKLRGKLELIEELIAERDKIV